MLSHDSNFVIIVSGPSDTGDAIPGGWRPNKAEIEDVELTV